MQTDLSPDRAVLVDRAWSVRMADSAIVRYAAAPARWHYEHGFLLKAIEQVWRVGGEAKYARFIQDTIDLFVDCDGGIRTYALEEYNLDQINEGRLLFGLWRETGDNRYQKAIHLLRRQLYGQPRTRSGGFWHKQIYPYQMWLDGVYMAGPFYAEYAQVFQESAGFDDVVHQIALLEEHARDPHTGLLYHAWDESRRQPWADPQTGCSPNFWGRAVGWYCMAIVDALDYLPPDHAARPTLIGILQRAAAAVSAVQDRSTGLWYQVLDQGERPGNYPEASASCMFVYALTKAVRQRVLPAEYLAVARRGYEGILRHFVRIDDGGEVNLDRVCSVAGLGGDPYRDGSFEYYVGEPVVSNDYKGVGAFILAATEMEMLAKNGPAV